MTNDQNPNAAAEFHPGDLVVPLPGSRLPQFRRFTVVRTSMPFLLRDEDEQLWAATPGDVRHALEHAAPTASPAPAAAAEVPYSLDAEDCEACEAVQDLCRYHRGVNDGVEWLATRLAAVARDPEILNSVKPIPWGGSGDVPATAGSVVADVAH